VHPRSALARPVDDGIERIERTGVHFSGLRAEDDWPVDVRQLGRQHASLIVRRHDDDVLAPEPDDRERLRNRRVCSFSDDDVRSADTRCAISRPA
jgi:hypothetical protein